MLGRLHLEWAQPGNRKGRAASKCGPAPRGRLGVTLLSDVSSSDDSRRRGRPGCPGPGHCPDRGWRRCRSCCSCWPGSRSDCDRLGRPAGRSVPCGSSPFQTAWAAGLETTRHKAASSRRFQQLTARIAVPARDRLFTTQQSRIELGTATPAPCGRPPLRRSHRKSRAGRRDSDW